LIALFKNPIPDSLLPTNRIKIFGKMLQTMARDQSRPLGLRHGRLMMVVVVVNQ